MTKREFVGAIRRIAGRLFSTNREILRGFWTGVLNLCALAMSLVLSPLIVMCVVWIMLEDGRPAIFSQYRVGRFGAEFRIYKLRTMKNGTANMPTHQIAPSEILRIGKFLRRSKLDEVPQVLNILRREMNLIGFRPCLPSQTNLIQLRRASGVLKDLPGLTGLSQVKGLDMQNELRLTENDRLYQQHQSMCLDAQILLATAVPKLRSRFRSGPLSLARSDALSQGD